MRRRDLLAGGSLVLLDGVLNGLPARAAELVYPEPLPVRGQDYTTWLQLPGGQTTPPIEIERALLGSDYARLHVASQFPTLVEVTSGASTMLTLEGAGNEYEEDGGSNGDMLIKVDTEVQIRFKNLHTATGYVYYFITQAGRAVGDEPMSLALPVPGTLKCWRWRLRPATGGGGEQQFLAGLPPEYKGPRMALFLRVGNGTDAKTLLLKRQTYGSGGLVTGTVPVNLTYPFAGPYPARAGEYYTVQLVGESKADGQFYFGPSG